MDAGVMSSSNAAEDYIINRAKSEKNQLSGKAWMITAKTLFPNNFGVQFEAYKIEKAEGRAKDAAKCFSDLIIKFQQQPEFWAEISKLTDALRTDSDGNDRPDPEKKFLCEMFTHISIEVQHKLLLLTADHCEDVMERCKLLMLLLQKFPSAIPKHGGNLIDTLLNAEKHCHTMKPLSPYRKLLVTDVLPLLNRQSLSLKFTMELPSKMLYTLLHKTMQYHFTVLSSLSPESDAKISEDSWNNMFLVVDFIGRHLHWEPYLTSFNKKNWSKENYWQKLFTFCQSPSLNLEDMNVLKQLAYCLTLFLIYNLHHYREHLCPQIIPGQIAECYVLVDAFTDPTLPPIPNEPRSKRRKTETDPNAPMISVEKPSLKDISSYFTMAVSCWDLIHFAELLKCEFLNITSQFKMHFWLDHFLVDYMVYKGLPDEALARLIDFPNSFHTPLISGIRKASLFYLKRTYVASYEHIVSILSVLPPIVPESASIPTPATVITSTAAATSSLPGHHTDLLTIGGTQRHLYFLPLTGRAILQYCTRLLLRSIRENCASRMGGIFSDNAIGAQFVLMQLDWPMEMEAVPALMKQLEDRRSFTFYAFPIYIIQVDILEELAFLWNSSGGHFNLDILPQFSQRRIGTRGADKGVKEEIRQAIRRQISRCNENIHQIVARFLLQERNSVTQTLM